MIPIEKLKSMPNGVRQYCQEARITNAITLAARWPWGIRDAGLSDSDSAYVKRLQDEILRRRAHIPKKDSGYDVPNRCFVFPKCETITLYDNSNEFKVVNIMIAHSEDGYRFGYHCSGGCLPRYSDVAIESRNDCIVEACNFILRIVEDERKVLNKEDNILNEKDLARIERNTRQYIKNMNEPKVVQLTFDFAQ